MFMTQWIEPLHINTIRRWIIVISYRRGDVGEDDEVCVINIIIARYIIERLKAEVYHQIAVIEPTSKGHQIPWKSIDVVVSKRPPRVDGGLISYGPAITYYI